MAKKWVLNNGNIILGHVDFHSQLCRDNANTIGGGWWFMHHDSNTIIYYGSSEDYGSVTRDQFERAYNHNAEHHKVFFSTNQKLAAALSGFEAIR